MYTQEYMSGESSSSKSRVQLCLNIYLAVVLMDVNTINVKMFWGGISGIGNTHLKMLMAPSD